MTRLYECGRCGGLSPRRRFCPVCRKVRDREIQAVERLRRGSSTERGYDAEHRRLRAEWAPLVATGTVMCARAECGRVILPGEPWDLGHDDFDRSKYTGPEHRACNRATTGRKRNTRRAPAWPW